jgi:hypothetical protein
MMYRGFCGCQSLEVGDVTMTDQNQMRKDRLHLTDTDITQEGFNFEDFWHHQLNCIKEIAENDESPKEGSPGRCGWKEINRR